MLTFRLYRYSIRNGNRDTDTPSEVEWKARTTKDGLYIETESNVYFFDIKNKEQDREAQVFLNKIVGD